MTIGPFSPSRSTSPDGINLLPPSFVPDPTGGWVCPHCMMTPYHLRALGSFSCDPPSVEYEDQHFACCFGLATSYQRTEEGSDSNQSKTLSSLQHQFSVNISPHSDCSLRVYEPHNAERDGTSIGYEWRGSGPPGFDCSPQPSVIYPIPKYPDPSSLQSTLQNTSAEDTARCFVTSLTHNTCASTGFPDVKGLIPQISQTDEEALVLLDDKKIITDFVYFVFQQLRICHFKESDRKTRGGKRDKLSIGFGGLECRHCVGENGSRKFFWTKVDRLATSFSEICEHTMTCHKSSDRIKDALKDLKRGHLGQMAMLPRGAQKLFFRRVWRRLHRNDEAYMAGSVTAPPSMFNRKDHSRGTSITAHSTKAQCLAIPSDTEWLSDIECSVRCSMEIFSASEADVMASKLNNNYPISLNQVGIRCIHCASTKEGATGSAIMFPSCINDIFRITHVFYQVHLSQCRNIPAKELDELSGLEKPTRTLSNLSKQHCVAAAKILGMYDTSDGIRLHRSIPCQSSNAMVDGVSLERGSKECNESGHESLSTCYGDSAPKTAECSPQSIGVAVYDEAPECLKRKGMPSSDARRRRLSSMQETCV